ncbi:MAG: hypothetical protein Q4C89_10145 [Deinococcus sp.]|uniref:hypothetical protein n=1 Tax=Deinococcus sp. TaxID=47478 RepID=UPI0026DC2313|nr:hypothetical protein [Deinococcus sp.]MDO4246372.1 hypothetical protein [Deinococcus sp.]
MKLSQIQDYGRRLLVGDLTTPKKEVTQLLTPEEVAALPRKHHWKDWTASGGLSHALARAVLRHDHHDKAQQFRAAAFLLACGSRHELGMAQLWCEANRDEVERFLSPAPAQTRAA